MEADALRIGDDASRRVAQVPRKPVSAPVHMA
jgi:hypothetical protein